VSDGLLVGASCQVKEFTFDLVIIKRSPKQCNECKFEDYCPGSQLLVELAQRDHLVESANLTLLPYF
jgi:hypothetical protein